MKKKSLLALFLTIAMLASSGCSRQNKNYLTNENMSANDSEQTDANSDDTKLKDTVPNDTESDHTVSDDTTSDSTALDDTASKDALAANFSNTFSERDFEVGYDEGSSARIQLNGNSAACSSNAVQISGSTVTITDEGTYILSGTLDNGMVIVNTDKTDKTQLVLDNVTIQSETCAPIYVLQSDKVFITMAAGSTNTLINGGTFTAIDENNVDAVIFSKEDITLNGSGTLIVTSPAGHGIVSKDSLKVTSGSYDINCASHALSGKDDVCVANAEFKIISGKDGIHAENADDATSGFAYIQSGNFNITAEGDGISASANMKIEDGTFDITSGGGSKNASEKTSDSWGGFSGGGRDQDGKGGRKGGPSDKMPPNTADQIYTTDQTYIANPVDTASPVDTSNPAEDTTDSSSIKGIKSTADLMINGGTFTINSADDSIHSNASVTIGGGTFEIASGDDAFHADETLTVTDGTIHITESYEGLEGMHIIISGGKITLVASDDGLNAAGGKDSSGTTGGRDGRFGHGMSSSSNGSITISGGTIHITANGDGMDANGSLEITGGDTVVCGPTQGDTATLDYDTSGTISSGTFIGTGASGMAQTFSTSKQGVLSVNVGSQPEGTEIILTDSDGNTLVTHKPDLSFEIVIISSPEIISGETYNITVGSDSKKITAS